MPPKLDPTLRPVSPSTQSGPSQRTQVIASSSTATTTVASSLQSSPSSAAVILIQKILGPEFQSFWDTSLGKGNLDVPLTHEQYENATLFGTVVQNSTTPASTPKVSPKKAHHAAPSVSYLDQANTADFAQLMRQYLEYLANPSQIKNLDKQGILRVPPSAAQIGTMMAAPCSSLLSQEDVLDQGILDGDFAANLLKRFAQSRKFFEEEKITTAVADWSKADTPDQKTQVISTLLDSLSPNALLCVITIGCLCQSIAEKASVNKMNPSNLALVISPNLFKVDDPLWTLTNGAVANVMTQFLIENVETFAQMLTTVYKSAQDGATETIPAPVRAQVALTPSPGRRWNPFGTSTPQASPDTRRKLDISTPSPGTLTHTTSHDLQRMDLSLVTSLSVQVGDNGISGPFNVTSTQEFVNPDGGRLTADELRQFALREQLLDASRVARQANLENALPLQQARARLEQQQQQRPIVVQVQPAPDADLDDADPDEITAMPATFPANTHTGSPAQHDLDQPQTQPQTQTQPQQQQPQQIEVVGSTGCFAGRRHRRVDPVGGTSQSTQSTQSTQSSKFCVIQ